MFGTREKAITKTSTAVSFANGQPTTTRSGGALRRQKKTHERRRQDITHTTAAKTKSHSVTKKWRLHTIRKTRTSSDELRLKKRTGCRPYGSDLDRGCLSYPRFCNRSSADSCHVRPSAVVVLGASKS